MISLTINNIDLEVPAGTTILDAARDNGIDTTAIGEQEHTIAQG